MNLRPVLYVIGILLTILSLSMILPMLADLYLGHNDWQVFFLCIIITAFFGGSLILSNAGHDFNMTIREAFLLTTLSWVFLATFGALPFFFCELEMSATDSFFESMSGITTTGATVIVGLDYAPPGILLWRAMLQWMGGIGIIVMALSVLPFLKVGGMQLFRTESSENEKALPRATQLSSSIAYIYLLLTLLCASFYKMSGMGTFDAIAHAMTTIATGGFSTYDTSFSHYDDPWSEIVATIFMLLGGIPFVLYLKAARGDSKAILKDSQVHWFLGIVLVSVITMVSYLYLQQNIGFGEALRKSSFNVVSLITGTGYTNGDYNQWGGFAVALLFFLMVIGGCAGSTSCGIKIFRFQILYAVADVQLKKLLHPSGVFIPYYNNKPIPPDVPMAVMGFFFMFALSFSVIAVILSYLGLDFLTAMSASASALANVGPGLGDIIGPTGTYEPLGDAAKWVLSGAMILGRLELLTILVMLTPHFWNR